MIRPRSFASIASFIMLFVAFSSSGQQSASAQTVQLPTLHRFSYSGTVVVPDRGGAYLGGVSRSSSNRVRRRFGGSTFGGAAGHSGAGVHVTIIDHDAIDRQLRGLPPKGSSGSTRRPGSKKVASAQSPTNKKQATRTVDPDAEGKALVRFARKQYLNGNHSSAFDAYRIAIETLSPKLAELAKAEFSRVFPDQRRPLAANPSRFSIVGNK